MRDGEGRHVTRHGIGTRLLSFFMSVLLIISYMGTATTTLAQELGVSATPTTEESSQGTSTSTDSSASTLRAATDQSANRSALNLTLNNITYTTGGQAATVAASAGILDLSTVTSTDLAALDLNVGFSIKALGEAGIKQGDTFSIALPKTSDGSNYFTLNDVQDQNLMAGTGDTAVKIGTFAVADNVLTATFNATAEGLAADNRTGTLTLSAKTTDAAFADGTTTSIAFNLQNVAENDEAGVTAADVAAAVQTVVMPKKAVQVKSSDSAESDAAVGSIPEASSDKQEAVSTDNSGIADNLQQALALQSNANQEYPEVTLTTLKDGIYIYLSAPEGVLPKGVTMDVQSAPQNEAEESAKTSLGAGVTVKDVRAFDITIKDRHGNVIQPSGNVSLSFTSLFNKGESLVAFYQDPSGRAQKLAEGGLFSVSFDTNHFSEYTVAMVDGKATTSVTDQGISLLNSNATQPDDSVFNSLNIGSTSTTSAADELVKLYFSFNLNTDNLSSVLERKVEAGGIKAITDPEFNGDETKYEEYLNTLANGSGTNQLPQVGFECYFDKKEIVLTEATTGVITATNPSGDPETVGQWTLTDDTATGKIKLTAVFYNKVYNKSLCEGRNTIQLKANFDLTTDQIPTLTKKDGDATISITFPGQPKEPKDDHEYSVGKVAVNSTGGQVTSVTDPYIDYVISPAITTNNGASAEYLAGYQVVDNIPSGMTVDRVEVLQPGSDVNYTTLQSTDYTLTDGKLSYTFPAAYSATTSSKVKIRLKLDEATYQQYMKSSSSFSKAFSNTAALNKSDNTTVADSDKVDVTMNLPAFATKSGEQVGITNEYKWNIALTTFFSSATQSYLVDEIQTQDASGNPTHDLDTAQPVTLTKGDGSSVTLNLVKKTGLTYDYGDLNDPDLLKQISGDQPVYFNNGKGQTIIIIPTDNYVNGSINIQYFTKLTAQSPTSSTDLKNDVKFLWKRLYYGDGPGFDDFDYNIDLKKNVNAYYDLVRKSAGDYDEKTRQLTWNFDINEYGKAMTNLNIEDIFDSSIQEFTAPASITLYKYNRQTGGSDPSGNLVLTTSQTSGNYFTVTDSTSPTGKKLTIHLSSLGADDYYRYSINTMVVDSSVLTTQDTSKQLNNTSQYTATVDGQPVEHSTTADKTVTNTLIKKESINFNEGQSTAYSFDYAQNAIKWRVTINPNNIDIKNAAVSDVLPAITVGGQTYYLDFGELSKITKTDKEGKTSDITNSKLDENSHSITFASTASTESAAGQYVINFQSDSTINNTYTFEFTTKFKSEADRKAVLKDTNYTNGSLPINNTATLTGLYKDTNIINVSDTATNNLKAPVLVKSGVAKNSTGTYTYNEGRSDSQALKNICYVEWQIVVNKDGTDMGGMTVTDDLKSLFELDQSTSGDHKISVYKATVSEDGTVVKGEDVTSALQNALTSTSSQLQFTIPNDVTYKNQPLIITFNTLVTDTATAADMTNSVKVTGYGYEDQTDIVTPSGSGSFDVDEYAKVATTPFLRLRKISFNSENEKYYPLQGAEFELVPQQKNTSGQYVDDASGEKIRLTSETGYANFLFLKRGVLYRVYETKAPAGYAINPIYSKTTSSGQYYYFENTTGPLTDAPDTTTQLASAVYTKNIPVTNSPVANSFSFTKKQDATDTAMSGITFKLQDADGLLDAKEATSDADGKVTFNNLDVGTFNLTEENTPDGFEPITATVTVAVDESGAIKVIMDDNGAGYITGDATTGYTVTNKVARGKISLTKADSGSGQLLTTAVFTIKDGTTAVAYLVYDETAGKYILTNTDGSTELNATKTISNFEVPYLQQVDGAWELLSGTYTLEETTVPIGYAAQASMDINITVTDKGQTVEKTVKNDPIKGTVKIKKTDGTSNAGVNGAVIGLYQDDTLKYQTMTATVDGAAGVALFENVRYGTYDVKEISAPVGYTVNTTYDKQVTINTQGEVVDKTADSDFQIIEARKPGKLTITKQDSLTNEAISGVQFTLYTKDPLGNYTQFSQSGLTNPAATDTAGQVTFDNLPWGTYAYQETASDTNHRIDDSTYHDVTVGVADGAVQGGGTETTDRLTYTATAKDTPKMGYIQLIKSAYEKNSDAIYIDSNVTMANVTYDVCKTDGTVWFKLTTGSDGKLPAPNSDGSYTYNGNKYYLTYDSYILKEESTGISAEQSDIDFTVSESTTADKGTAWFNFNNSTNTVQYVIEGATAPTADFSNQIIRGGVSFEKVSASDSAIKLSGAVFGVFAGKTQVATITESTTTGTYNVINPLTTPVKNTNGVAYVKEIDGTNQLLAGTYTIKEETVPIGYKKASDFTVTIGLDGTTTYSNQINNGELKDKPISITLKKLDDAGSNVIGGSTFTLSGNFAKYASGVTATDNKTFTVSPAVTNGIVLDHTTLTDAGGSYNLVSGQTYTLTEITAPDGYRLLPKIRFTVNASGNISVSVNPKIYPLALADNTNPSAAAASVNNSATLNVRDVLQRANAMITKVSSAAGSPTIAGARFSIYKYSGETPNTTSDQLVASGLITDSNGLIDTSTISTVNNALTGKALKYGMTEGKYYFLETFTPAGYKDVAYKGTNITTGDNQNTFAFTITDSQNAGIATLDKIDAGKATNTPIDTHLKLIKTNSENTATKLAGAEFTLVGTIPTADGTATTTQYGITDSNGELKIKNEAGSAGDSINLQRGSYTLTETKAPAGYVLQDKDGNPFKCTFSVVNADLDKTIVIQGNNPTATGEIKATNLVTEPANDTRLAGTSVTNVPIQLNLSKVLSDGQESPAPSATITVEPIQNQTFADGTVASKTFTLASTNQDIGLNLIAGNTYIIKETAANAGYRLLPHPLIIQIDQKGQVSIVTTGSVTDQSGSSISASYDASGAIGGLTFAGETIDSTTNFVKNNISVQNHPIAVTLVKQGKKDGSQTTTPLSGVTFNLTGSFIKVADGTTVDNMTIAGLTTGTDGKLILDKDKLMVGADSYRLTAGTYTLTETTKPDNYKLLSPITFTVSDIGAVTTTAGSDFAVIGQTSASGGVDDQLTLTNYEIVGSAELTKVAAGTTTPIPGVTFQLYKMGNGGTYALYNNTVYTTDNDGKISVTGLPIGTYYFKETSAPVGYVSPADTDTYGFTITEAQASDKGLVTVTSGYTHPYSGATTVEKAENAPINAKLKLYKYDATLTEDSQALQGAVFNIQYKAAESGSYNNYHTDLAPFTTNNDGLLKDKNGNDVSLDRGFYKITEITAPTGYILGTSPFSATFKVTNDSKDKTVEISNGNNKAEDLTVAEGTTTSTTLTASGITNTRIPGSVALLKVKENGTALPGAEFTLYIKDGTGYKMYGEQTYTTDSSGKITISDLPWGDYKIAETKAAPGYVLGNPAPSKTFTVNKDQQAFNFTTDQEKIKNTSTSITINKTDAGGTTLLTGATLKITGTFADGTSEKSIFNNTDNVIVGGFIIGNTYKLTETGRPAGYEGFYGEVTFHLDNAGLVVIDANPNLTDNAGAAVRSADGRTLSLRNVPYTGSVTLTKKEFGSETKLLQGITYYLYKEKTVGTQAPATDEKITKDGSAALTTDSSGQISVSGLTEGTYYFVEHSTLDNYQLDTTLQAPFNITDSSADHIHSASVMYTNKPMAVKVAIRKFTSEDTSLKGATFTLYKGTEAIATLKDNGDGTYITNSAVSSKGTYTIKETSAPIGYQLTSTPFEATFTIGDSDNGKTLWVGSSNSATAADIVMKNETGGRLSNVVGTLDNTKGVSNNEVGFNLKKTFAGGTDGLQASFTIAGNFADATGALVTKTSQAITATKDTSVKLDSTTLKDADGNALKLVAGQTYNITETATADEYQLVTTAIRAKVSDDGTQLSIVSTPKLGNNTDMAVVSGTTLTVNNIKVTAGATLTKTGEDANTKLKGVTFDLYKGTPGSGTRVANQSGKTTNADGQVSVSGLGTGSYYFVEMGTQSGYHLSESYGNVSDNPLTFTIGQGDYGVTKTVKVSDRDPSNEKFLASLTFKKYDVDNGTTGIAGATFKLTAPDGTSQTIATGESGTYTGTGVLTQKGKYTIEELTAQGYQGSGFFKGTFNVAESDFGNTMTLSNSNVAATQGTIDGTGIQNKRIPGSIALTKYDSEETGMKLSGVAFTLHCDSVVSGTKPDDQVKTSNSSGYLQFTDLPWGTYTITETQADGYIIPTDRSYTVTIDADVQSFTLKDTGTEGIYNTKNSYTFGKVDENGSAVNGATLRVYAQGSNTPVALKYNGGVSWLTESEINVNHTYRQLPAGNYVMKEDGVPAGYAQADPVYFYMDAHGVMYKTDNSWSEESRTVVANNKLVMTDNTLKITLDKTKLDGTTQLTGAQFKLYEGNDSSGDLIWAGDSSDSNWTICEGTSGMQEGKHLIINKTYTLVEETAPFGYYKVAPVTFTVAADGTISSSEQTITGNHLTFKDAPILLEIKKLDEGTDSLSGATLKIYEGNDTTGNVVWTSTEGDTWHVDAQLIGTDSGKEYTLAEEVTPSGYIAALPITFKVYSDYSITVNGKAAEKDGDSYLIKMNDPLLYTSLSILKTENEGGQPLDEVVFTLSGKDFNGNKVTKEVQTDVQGQTTIYDIPVGTYTLTETKVKDYEEPRVYDVVVTNVADGNSNKADIKVTDQTTKQDLKPAEDDYYNIVNTLIRRSFTFTKNGTDDELDLTHNSALAGASFGLYSDEEAITQPLKVVTSGSDGQVTFSDIQCGTWYIKEITAPANYKVDSTIYPLTVAQDGSVTCSLTTSVNEAIRGSFTMTKVDEEDHSKVVPNTTYSLYKKQESGVGTSSVTSLLGSLGLTGSEHAAPDGYTWVEDGVTGADGKVTFSNLLIGFDYMVKETSAPDGYQVSEKPIVVIFTLDEENQKAEVKVTDTGNGTVTVDKDGNVIWLEPPTRVAFQKQDSNGQALSGAVLTLTDSSGKVVDSWTSDGSDHLLSSVLVAGKQYTLTETAAPAGYDVASPVTFTVEDKELPPGQMYTQYVTMVDAKTQSAANTGINGSDTGAMIALSLIILSAVSGGLYIVVRRKREAR